MLEPTERLTHKEATFLAKNVESIDMSNIDVPVDFQSAIYNRLE